MVSLDDRWRPSASCHMQSAAEGIRVAVFESRTTHGEFLFDLSVKRVDFCSNKAASTAALCLLLALHVVHQVAHVRFMAHQDAEARQCITNIQTLQDGAFDTTTSTQPEYTLSFAFFVRISCLHLEFVRRKVLVLDLDETLIHSHHDGITRPMVAPGTPADYILKVHLTFLFHRTRSPLTLAAGDCRQAPGAILSLQTAAC